MKREDEKVSAKPQKKSATFRRLLGFMKPFRRALVCMLLFLILGTVFTSLGPYLLGVATNTIAASLTGTLSAAQALESFTKVLVLLGAVYLLGGLFKYASLYLMAGISEKTMFSLRGAVDDKLRRLPLQYFDAHAFGDILSRVTNDVDTVATALQQSVEQVISSFFTMLFILIMMLVVSPTLTLIGLLVLPLCALATAFIAKRSQTYFRGQQNTLGEINGYVEEMYSGQLVIAAFGKEADVIGQFEEINDKLFHHGWKAQFISSIIMPVIQALTNVGYVGVAVVSGFMCISGTLSVGMIQSFIQYLRQFSQPIMQIAQIANIMQATAAAGERIFAFLDAEEELPDVHTPHFPQDPKGAVCFEHARFGYSPNKILIHDLSLQVQAGDKVAIVGPTGAGKTTLVNLILRFYDVLDGKILIDGVDVREMERQQLRSLIGMVLQDTWLFTGSIRENIRYGRLDATDEQVLAAAKAAHAHGFIKALPGGYDMVLHEGAVNLAQGERQLLTIARAILSDPKILILDEATSSVDTRTEAAIQKAMGRLMEGRTSFVIAHRLSTIKDAETILYMENGDIKETGTHTALLEKGGYYAALYNSQFAENNRA